MSSTPMMMSSDDNGVRITHIAGTIEVAEKDRLKKLLFRATRGKALTFFQDFQLDQKYTQQTKSTSLKDKSVYIVVFQEGRQMRERIMRICDSFLGQRFEIPQVQSIPGKLVELRRNINESRVLYETTRRQLRDFLVGVNLIHQGSMIGESRSSVDQDPPSLFEVYKWFVAKEKAIYATMNCMRSGGAKATFVGYFWSPTAQEEAIRAALGSTPRPTCSGTRTTR